MTDLKLYYAELSVKGTATVTNVTNDGGTLSYTRTNGKPNLTINGTVTNRGTSSELVLNMVVENAEAAAADFEVTATTDKNGISRASLADEKKLATVGTAALSAVDFKLNGNSLTESTYLVVKANKGAYLVGATGEGISGSYVELQVGEAGSQIDYYLDIYQAVTEINNLNDKTAAYTINLHSKVTDTCLTDTVQSALTLPANNRAASVTITAGSSGTVLTVGSGAISYTGTLHLKNLELNVPGAMSVTELILTDTNLTTQKNATFTDVVLNASNSCNWKALGTTTVKTLTNTSGTESNSSYTVIAKLSNNSDTTKATPMFTISGSVNGNVNWAVVEYSYIGDEESVVSVASADVKLVKAMNASAERFVTDLTSSQTPVYYACKDTSGYVYYIELTDSTVKLSYDDSTTYAKSFADAVSIINSMNDRTRAYTIQFLSNEDNNNPESTLATGTVYGALTLPTKASSLTIKGAEGGTTELRYTGTLKSSVDLTFDNICLTEVTYKAGNYTPSYAVTPSFGSTTLTFENDVTTLKENPEEESDVDLVFTSLTGTGGTMELDGLDVFVEGAVNVKDLSASSSSITSAKAMKITNISGDNVTLGAYCTTANASQLTISGTIDATSVTIVPYVYKSEGKTYSAMGEDDAASLLVGAESTPTSNQKLATLTKGSTENIKVKLGENTTNYKLFKYNSGLYLTNEEILVQVEGYSEGYDGEKNYQAGFLSWAQAVSEINTIKDKTAYYKIVLQGDLGITKNTEDGYSTYYELNPASGLTMPTWAAEVTVTSDNADSAAIFFTGTTLTLNCDTVFENVGLFALKAVRSGYGTYYEGVTYALRAGSYSLTERNMLTYVNYDEDANSYNDVVSNGTTDDYESSSGAITGSAKRTLTVGTELSAASVSGFGKVVVEDSCELSLSGAFSSTDLTMEESSTLAAKNVTVTGTATLNGATISAGTTTIGDGMIKLADVVIGAAGNVLEAKQDRNGDSLVTVTGTVSGEDEVIAICLWYNNRSGYARLHSGMTLLTATKADSTWFSADTTSMGELANGYGFYKSGTAVKYGAVS